MSDATTAPAYLTCPECKHSIGYYDVQGSSFYACPQCHTYFKYEGEGPPVIIGRYKHVPKEQPLIPLGTLGRLAGPGCRVVGFVVRNELHAARYRWTEYQLYQPATNDYAQLAMYNGHWMLIRPAAASYQPKPANRIFTPEGSYKLYNRYQARVQYAVGEFDWDIEGDDAVNISEFINPPTMLVRESERKSSTWFRAEHLEPATVATAFGLDLATLPKRDDVGAIQPGPDSNWPAVRNLTLVAIALLVLLQLGAWQLRPSRRLLEQAFTTSNDSTATPGTSQVIVSSSFELREPAALQIDIRADVDNQWLELPISLVNETTGRGYEFTRTVEYYHGYEDGENWAEGGHEGDALLSAVPAGRYHLNLYPFSEKEQGPNLQPLRITIGVTENPTLTSNFFIVLLLLLVYPAWQFMSRTIHEAQRWESSDFSPY